MSLCRSELSNWVEGEVVLSPERTGNLTGVVKGQIDWLPLEVGSVRPTQGRTLAVMQVSGGSQSFNAVNALRVLGRWMRMEIEEHTSELQSLMRISYAVFCLKKKKTKNRHKQTQISVQI